MPARQLIPDPELGHTACPVEFAHPRSSVLLLADLALRVAVDDADEIPDDPAEVTCSRPRRIGTVARRPGGMMKGSEKPRKLEKKRAQKLLKQRRSEKRAAPKRYGVGQ